MINFLGNGTVLPHGLLGHNHDVLDGFSRTYQNTALKVGVIVTCYPASDEKNKSKIATEYDVVAIEQNADKGSNTSIYHNCLSASGLGSIADFFERTLRTRKAKKYKEDVDRLAEQNGSTVLLLCLDGSAEKALIIGCFPHPDRKTTLKDDKAYLEGEYNGINIKVETDGSTSLTFKGATDEDGKILDKEQGPTSLKVEKDGSFQVDHKTAKFRMDKKGKVDLTSDDDISNTTKKSFNVTATENVAIKSTKNMSMDVKDLLSKASGTSTFETDKMAVKASSEIKFEGGQFQVEASSLAKIKATTITLDGLVSLGGDGGQPILLLSTQMIGIGPGGAPITSTAISGYATKVTAI